MKAADLHLLELLDVRPEEGTIRFAGQRRMLLWDADAFGNLRRELLDSLGPERARPILRRFGFANGYRDALTTGEIFQWDDDAEWWLSCPALQRHEGKVLAEPEHLVVDRERGRFEMEVLWNNSYEAEQHVRVFGPAEEPVCWTLAGFASGFATALMGEECLVVETDCAAQNGTSCRVVGKTRRAWGARGDDYAADYTARSLSEELEARESELRRQRRALRRRERELEKLRGGEVTSRGGIICRSRAMESVLDLAETVARVASTVLVTGESGVGKERVARFIHEESPRSEHPFVAVNCGALPETLLESALFGHVRGAFTGADSDREGLFEAARGGTLFLDEIGETSPATQVKLLRALQEREVMPVGATRPRKTDVRVIAATNRDLDRMVASGEFRTDLYYRLKVVVIDIPPLRERPEDVLPLARHLLAGHAQAYALGDKRLAPEAVDALTSHRWPGNVRELANAIERAVILSGDRPKIDRSDLPRDIESPRASHVPLRANRVMPIADLERRYVLEVLEHFDGNRAQTARALGIATNTLWRKLKSWGVPPARETDPTTH